MGEILPRAESASPLYAQIMDRIRMDILGGVYPAGSRIPAEHELEERYAVSRVTVRRAMQELTAAGMLERKQGKGTFVSQPRTARRERLFQDFFDGCRDMGKTPSVLRIRVQETPATDEDREKLSIPAESKVVRIRRLLAADGEPVILETNRFSMAYSWLESAELKGSLYRMMQEYGIRAEKSNYDFSLRRADADEAALLRVENGAVLLAVEQVVYDQKGRPLHTGSQLIRGDRYTMRI